MSRILLSFVAGLGAWLISIGLHAQNPSLNGIVYGGLFCVCITLLDILEEIKSQKPK